LRGITNVAHRGSIVILARHAHDLLRKFRRLADSADQCTPALLLRVSTPVLVTTGILAVTAMVAAMIYERVSVFLLVLGNIDEYAFALVGDSVCAPTCSDERILVAVTRKHAHIAQTTGEESAHKGC
jgi:hypothetical protein